MFASFLNASYKPSHAGVGVLIISTCSLNSLLLLAKFLLWLNQSQQQLTRHMNVWQRADVCFGMWVCGNWASIERYCAEKELHSSEWTLGRALLLGVSPAVCNLLPLGVTEITRLHLVVSFVCFYKSTNLQNHTFKVWGHLKANTGGIMRNECTRW